jgi:hypothetical protein
MHVPDTHLSGNDWPTNDTVETEYIGSLENVVTAVIRDAKTWGKPLSNGVREALADLARANQNLGDTLHMTDSENMVTVEGHADITVYDHSVEYLCKTKGNVDFRFIAFPPNAAKAAWHYTIQMLDGVHGKMCTGTAHSGYRHLSFDGVPLDNIAGNEAWLDSYSGDGVVFHYDNMDEEFVLKLDGMYGDYKDAATLGEFLGGE